MRNSPTRTSAFTLIELLTVIAIIGVLAGLLFPAIKSALQRAEIAQAQNDVKNIEAALKAFYTEYGKWPNPWPPNGAGPINDFSYGAIANAPNYGANGTGTYCPNYWLMNVLRAIQDNGTVCGNAGTPSINSLSPPVNSRGIMFLTIPAKSLKVVDLNRGYADYVDPWGNPYQITVDTSYDGMCCNLANASLNTTVITPLGTGNVNCVSNSVVAVWSFGPLGPYAPSHNAKDWITSW
jgi:prepilin-type N-terminal cleavage/methylation domain-containing protein